MGVPISANDSSQVYVPQTGQTLGKKKKKRKYQAATQAAPAVQAPVVSPVERQMRDINLAYHKVYGKLPSPDKVFNLMQSQAPGMETMQDWEDFFRVGNPLAIDPNAAKTLFKDDYSVTTAERDPAHRSKPMSKREKGRMMERRGTGSDAKVTPWVDTGRQADGQDDGGGHVSSDYEYERNGNYKKVTKTVMVSSGRGPSIPVTTEEWVYDDPAFNDMDESDFYAGIGVEPGRYDGLKFKMFGGAASPMLPAEDVKYLLKYFDKQHYTEHYNAYKAARAAGTEPEQDDIYAHNSWIQLASWVSRATGDDSLIAKAKSGRDFDQWNAKLLNAYMGGLVERYLPYYVHGDDEQKKKATEILKAVGMDVAALTAGLEAMSVNEPERLNKMLYDGFVRWRPGNQSEENAKWEYGTVFGNDAMPAADAQEMSDQKWGVLDDIGNAALQTGKGAAGALGWTAGKAGAAVGATWHVVPGHGLAQDAGEAVADSTVGKAVDKAATRVGQFAGAVAKGIVGTSAEYAQLLSRAMTATYWVATASLIDEFDPDADVFKGAYRHEYSGDVWDRWKTAFENSGAHVETFVNDGQIWDYSMEDGKYHVREKLGETTAPLEVVPEGATPVKASEGAQWVTREVVNDIFMMTGISDHPDNLPLIGAIAFAADMAIGLKFDTVGDLAIRYGAKYTAKGVFKGARAGAKALTARKLIKGAETAADAAEGPAKLAFQPGYVKFGARVSLDVDAIKLDGEAEFRKALKEAGVPDDEVARRANFAKARIAGASMDELWGDKARVDRQVKKNAEWERKEAKVQQDEQAAIAGGQTGPTRDASGIPPRAPVLVNKNGVFLTAHSADFPEGFHFRGRGGDPFRPGQEQFPAGSIYHEDVKEAAGISQDSTNWGHVRIDDRLRFDEVGDGAAQGMNDQLILSMGNFSEVNYTEDFVQNIVTDLLEGGYIGTHRQALIGGWAISPTTAEVMKQGTQLGSKKLYMLAPDAYKTLKEAGYEDLDIAQMQRGQKDFPDFDELKAQRAEKENADALDELRTDPWDADLGYDPKADLVDTGKRWTPADEGLTDAEYWEMFGDGSAPNILYAKKKPGPPPPDASPEARYNYLRDQYSTKLETAGLTPAEAKQLKAAQRRVEELKSGKPGRKEAYSRMHAFLKKKYPKLYKEAEAYQKEAYAKQDAALEVRRERYKNLPKNDKGVPQEPDYGYAKKAGKLPDGTEYKAGDYIPLYDKNGQPVLRDAFEPELMHRSTNWDQTMWPGRDAQSLIEHKLTELGIEEDVINGGLSSKFEREVAAEAKLTKAEQALVSKRNKAQEALAKEYEPKLEAIHEEIAAARETPPAVKAARQSAKGNGIDHGKPVDKTGKVIQPDSSKPPVSRKGNTRKPKNTEPLPEPAFLPHTAPRNLAEWNGQMGLALGESVDPKVIDRLGTLVGANAAYLGQTTDEYITRTLLGVVRGDHPVTIGDLLIGSPVFKTTGELAKKASVKEKAAGAVGKNVVKKFDTAEAGRALVRSMLDSGTLPSTLASKVGLENLDAMASYYVKTFDDEATRLMEDSIAWMKKNRVGQESGRTAIRHNGKTMLSVDVSTNCTFRKRGRPCLYCYIEMPRSYNAVTGKKAAGLTPHSVEEVGFKGTEFDDMPDELVDFMATQHGGLRMFSAGDWDPDMADQIEALIEAAGKRVSPKTGELYPVKLKIITKQRELLDRIMNDEWPHVTVDMSIDSDPDILRGVLPRKVAAMYQKATRQSFSNTMTLAQADELYNHPRIFKRYIVMHGRAEAIRAAMDPRVDNITIWHSAVTSTDDIVASLKHQTPSLFESSEASLRAKLLLLGHPEKTADELLQKAKDEGIDLRRAMVDPVDGQIVRNEAALGEGFVREMVSHWKNYNSAHSIWKKGANANVGDIEWEAASVKKVLGADADIDEVTTNLIKKVCCQTHKCGTCFVCSGLRTQDFAYAAAAIAEGVPMASVQFLADGRALVRGLTAPTPGAMAHEIGHLFRRTLSKEDLAVVKKWAGMEADEGFTVETEEQFAEAFREHFEEYVETGKLPDPVHQGIIEKFKLWVARVWANVKGTPTEQDMSLEMRKLFDRYAEPLRQEQRSKRIGFRGYFTEPGTGSLPLFLNNHAEFIARLKPGTKSQWWLKHLYNLSNDEANTVIDVELPDGTVVQKTAVEALADETDPQRVHKILNDLSDDPFGFVIDGWQAATWKQWRLRYATGKLPAQHPAFFHQLVNPLVDQTKSGNDTADTDILRITISTHGTGKLDSGQNAYDYAERMFAAKTGAAKAEVWDQYWSDMQKTLEKQPKRIGRAAARSMGIDPDSVTNMWEYWLAYKTAYYRVKGKPKAAFAAGRAYKGATKERINAKGEVEKYVEEQSAVIPSGLAQRLAAELQKADEEFDQALQNSSLSDEAKKHLEAARDEARKRFEEYKRNPDAFRLSQPFFEGQLRQGYLHPFDPSLFQKFMAGRNARMWEFNQAKKRRGLLGYSIDEWITAYKELVMSTTGFPLRVTVGDEGVRLVTEGIVSPLHPWRWKNEAKVGATLDGKGKHSVFKPGVINQLIEEGKLPPEVIEDLTLWTRSHSDDFVSINVGSPRYGACLLGELKMVRDDTMFKAFDRMLTANNGDMKKTVAQLKRLVKSNTDEGAAIRQLLVDTHRLTPAQAANPSKLNFGKVVIDDAAEQVQRQNPLTEWLDQWVDYMAKLDNAGFMQTMEAGGSPVPRTLRQAVSDGVFPDESILKQIPPEKLWPVVMRNEPWQLGDGGVQLPFVHWFAQNVTFKLMEATSNRMRALVFTRRFEQELNGVYTRAKRAGRDIDEQQAFNFASKRAIAYTNAVQYTHNATVFEDLARNTVMFMPAYRQYLTYWSKYAVKEPLVMARLQGYRAAQKDQPTVIGDFSGFMPSIPFGWDTPAFSPLVTTPLRVVNAATHGSLRGIEDLPMMSFSDPRTSVLSRFDDLLWGMFGASIPGLSSDRTAREMLALRIAQGQIANGISPNPEQGLEEMAKQPGWWKVIENTFGKPGELIGHEGHPEAIVSFLSKQFLPASLSYMPKYSRDMLQAEFDWTAAKTQDQRLAVLLKYPDYGKVIKYRRMTESEREAFLMDPANVKLLPLLKGKNNYDNAGLLLTYDDYYNALQRGQISRKTVLQYSEEVKALRDAVWYTKSADHGAKVAENLKRKGKKWAEQIALKYTHGRRNSMFRAMMSDYESPHYVINADGVTTYVPQWPFNGKGGYEHCPDVIDQTYTQKWGEKPLLTGHRPGGSNFDLDVSLPGWHPPNDKELDAVYKAKKLGAYGDNLNYTPGRTPYFVEFRAREQKVKMAKVKATLNMSTDGFWELDRWSLAQMGVPTKPGWDEARAKHNHAYQMLKNEKDRKAYYGTDSYNEAKAKYIREGEVLMDKYAPYMRQGVPGRLIRNKYLTEPRYDAVLHMTKAQQNADPKGMLSQANRAIDVLDKWYDNKKEAYAAVEKMMDAYGWKVFHKAFGGDDKASKQAAQFIGEEFRATWWRAMLHLFYKGREALRLTKNKYHDEYLGTTTGSKDGERVLNNLLKNVRIIQDVEKKYGIESGFVAEWRELGGATLGRALLDWSK